MGSVILEGGFDDDETAVFFEMMDMAVGDVGLYTIVGDVSDEVTDAIKDGFAAEAVPLIGSGGAGGLKWKSLAMFTIQDREHNGFPGKHPINERTGGMMGEVTSSPTVRKSGPNEYMAEIPENMGPFTELKLTTAQFGDVFSKTPARPVLPAINEAEELVLVEVAEATMQNTLNALFGASL